MGFPGVCTFKYCWFKTNYYLYFHITLCKTIIRAVFLCLLPLLSVIRTYGLLLFKFRSNQPLLVWMSFIYINPKFKLQLFKMIAPQHLDFYKNYMRARIMGVLRWILSVCPFSKRLNTTFLIFGTIRSAYILLFVDIPRAFLLEFIFLLNDFHEIPHIKKQ